MWFRYAADSESHIDQLESQLLELRRRALAKAGRGGGDSSRSNSGSRLGSNASSARIDLSSARMSSKRRSSKVPQLSLGGGVGGKANDVTKPDSAVVENSALDETSESDHG